MVSAKSYCTRNTCRKVTPRHASIARFLSQSNRSFRKRTQVECYLDLKRSKLPIHHFLIFNEIGSFNDVTASEETLQRTAFPVQKWHHHLRSYFEGSLRSHSLLIELSKRVIKKRECGHRDPRHFAKIFVVF